MIIEALDNGLPPAALLLGPDLAQMAQDAAWIVRGYGVLAADRMVLRHVSAADARNIVKFAQTAPFGPFKVVIAVLDGATAQAQNILLKVLEEPPGTLRFILVATQSPLPTIVSRCQVITVPAAGGQPEADGQVAKQVADALKYAAAGDLTQLDAALRGWGHEHHAVLILLLAEQATAEPGQQDPRAPARARRLLGALGRYDGAHPRLAAHAALVSVFASEPER